jgi:hypothetical protein
MFLKVVVLIPGTIILLSICPLIFDAINEVEGLPVEKIVTDFETKSYVVSLEDRSEFVVRCAIQRN